MVDTLAGRHQGWCDVVGYSGAACLVLCGVEHCSVVCCIVCGVFGVVQSDSQTLRVKFLGCKMCLGVVLLVFCGGVVLCGAACVMWCDVMRFGVLWCGVLCCVVLWCGV